MTVEATYMLCHVGSVLMLLQAYTRATQLLRFSADIAHVSIALQAWEVMFCVCNTSLRFAYGHSIAYVAVSVPRL